MNGYPPHETTAPYWLASGPSATASTPRREWMGPVGVGVDRPYGGRNPLPPTAPRSLRDATCLGCPYFAAACDMGRSPRVGEGHSVRAQGHPHGADVDRRHNRAARSDREEARFDPVADAKVLARYARIKAAHHVLAVLRLTRSPRTAFVVLTGLLCLFGFSIGMDLAGY